MGEAGGNNPFGAGPRFFTRILIAVAVMLSFSALAAAGVESRPLTSLSMIHALTNDEASHAIPVAFEATVTYFSGNQRLLFVQDGDAAIFVHPPADVNLNAGDRILVRGVTQESFRPMVVSSSIALLHHGNLPNAVPADFDGLIRAEHDCTLVRVDAVVRAADMVVNSANGVRQLRLQLMTDGGHIEAVANSENESAVQDLLDAEVEVIGADSGEFDNKMQQIGVRIYVSSLANIRILKRAAQHPWSLPVTSMDRVLSSYHIQDLSQRVRVHGTITYYQPGSAIVLQDGNRSLWITTASRAPLQIGDIAFASGFPDAHGGLLTLTDGEVQDTHVVATSTPISATWLELAYWSINKSNGHQFDLVSVEGRVVTEVQEAAQAEYVVAAGDRLFTAIYRYPSATGKHSPMAQIPRGSKVHVTGICMIVDASTGNKGHEVPFNILMRSFDDIAVVAKPSPLNVRNLIILVGLLLAMVGMVGARGWVLERKVRRQTAAMAARVDAEAALERRRSTILEDINGTRSLTEIVERITELVSSKLDGAPCWCLIADGAQLGNCPPDMRHLRILRAEIPARSGSALGTIFVGFDPNKAPAVDEKDVLSVGTRLATLAIETRRLYSDLKHRSEFDLLTGVHNRFSMERYLDAQLEESRRQAGVFGLIYVDLDKFKQVNDLYGHLVGDMYLQEVAQRMKRQLRPNDMLARLGGDEFAVLVPSVHDHPEVQEIARRLEATFDDPYCIEGYILHSSASVGFALYPADGATRESLLSAADAAMYLAKQSKRHDDELPSGRRALEVAPGEGI